MRFGLSLLDGDEGPRRQLGALGEFRRGEPCLLSVVDDRFAQSASASIRDSVLRPRHDAPEPNELGAWLKIEGSTFCLAAPKPGTGRDYKLVFIGANLAD